MLAVAQEARWSAGAAGSHSRVAVTRLALTNFRNYREARLALEPGPVVLTGPNGAGKTNLLEALSFLAPGRGLRAARLSDIDRRPPVDPAQEAAQGWAVAATVATRGGARRIGTGREAAEGERRVVRIDGEPARSQAALGDLLGVVWLTPLMDRLFLEGPAGRRRFLDQLVVALDPAHAARVGAYEHALRERTGLLRGEFAQHRTADPAWLAALEEVMAARGVAVAAARRAAVQRLDRAGAEAERPFPRARLALVGRIEALLDEMPALAVEAAFAEALAASRREDALCGGASIGPHRCDLRVRLAESDVAAESASTGEQKALLISILLAHARLQRALRGEPPLLLLDEVAAHLDAGRRAALFEALDRLSSQVWLTGTDEAVFAALRGGAQFLAVNEGALTEIKS